MDAKFKIGVELSGFEQLAKRFSLITSGDVLEGAVKEALEMVKQRLQEYPPEPPGSTYVRTGTLYDEWRTFPGVMQSINTFGGTVENWAVSPNGVHYSKLVQHDRLFGDAVEQTEQHAVTGWPTDQEVLDELAPEITALFGKAIGDSWGGRDLSGGA